MHFSISTLLTTAYLALGATALPNPRPAATYKVVDVGGPSSSIDSPPAETLSSASISATKPETVTVTASPSRTATQSTTVTVQMPAFSYTVTMSPVPVIVTPSTATETIQLATTETVYNTVPAPTYATAVQSSSSSSSSSATYTSTFKSAFTGYGQWNQTISTTTYPPAGTAVYSRFPTSVPCPDEKKEATSY